MKIKYFLIYVIVGAAFLGVSLWVFLSGGKNARALRAKYRLGGLVLTAWAMLSVSSCSCGPLFPQVTCYEPVMPENIVRVQTETMTRGTAMTVTVSEPAYADFRWKIYDKEKTGVLQQGDFKVPDEHDYTVSFDIVPDQALAPGDVVLVVEGFYLNDDGKEVAFELYSQNFVLQ